jgi:DnaK suppressor protein
MPPISSELHEEIGKRLRKSREDVLAAVHARTDGDTDDRPAISPMAHMGSNDDAPAGEMLSHNEEHLAEHETNLLHDIDTAIGRLEAGGYGICILRARYSRSPPAGHADGADLHRVPGADREGTGDGARADDVGGHLNTDSACDKCPACSATLPTPPPPARPAPHSRA